jgi:hypothetical protein
MSLARCDKCKVLIDTDEQPEACVEFEEYGCNFLCSGCQEDVSDLMDNMGNDYENV